VPKLLLSKLTDDKKYVYDDPTYNFYFLKFNHVFIYFTGDEDIYNSNQDIRISISSNKIEIIYRWLKLTKYKFYIQIKFDSTRLPLFINSDKIKEINKNKEINYYD
jgi:hypothetical protein